MPPFVSRKRQASTPPPASQPKAKKSKQKLQQSNSPGDSVADKKQFLDSLAAENDSELSDVDSDDFEDVLHPATIQAHSEDEDVEWEDAMNEDTPVAGLSHTAVTAGGDMELTLGGNEEQSELKPNKKKGPSKIERQIRISTHCIHVQFLLWHNTIRNAWISDVELHAILLAQLPPTIKEVIEQWRRDCGDALQPAARLKEKPKGKSKSKAKGKTPVKQKERDWGQDAGRQEKGGTNMSRADPTLRMLKYLAKYWCKAFTITAPGIRKRGYKTTKILKQEMASFANDKHDPELHGERIANVQEFRECAKRREGSRDVGAQLFTALCRALGVEARLVANLQPLGFGWNKAEEAEPRKRKVISEEQAESSSNDELSDDSVKVEKPASVLKSKVVVKTKPIPTSMRNLRNGTKETPVNLDDSSELSDAPSEESIVAMSSRPKKRLIKRYDRDLPFPNYWTEVVSPISFKVYPVDSMLLLAAPATNDEHLALFEPRGSKADKAKQVIAYVIGHSPDGTAKDVTTRYLRRHMWPSKTKGMRMTSERIPIYNRKGKIKSYQEYDWFKTVMSGYERPARLRTQVDDIEEATDLKPVKVEKKAVQAGEESLQYYKQSAEFVLERFLRREEALLPGAKSVKTFVSGKGNKIQEDPVFLRSDVVACKTEESWHKEGRRPKEDAVPLKYVPIRAVTITRKREIEDLTRRNNGQKPMQPLYSKKQTEYIIPPPIENGVIPKNAYGNIDCFVPSMVPEGAVHVPLRSTARVCKKLGFDYAEAVIGFEFGNKMAVPVIQGVVVAEENRQALIDAWNEEEAARRVKEDEKQLKLVLATWRKFLMGLRIFDRFRAEIGDDPAAFEKTSNPFKRTNLPKDDGEDEELEGGFLHDDEDEAGGGELEVIDHSRGILNAKQSDQEDVPTGGGFMTDDTPEDTTDKVFDHSLADEISSALSSDADEEHTTSTKRTQQDLSRPKLSVPSLSSRIARRAGEVKSKYFDGTDEEDNESEENEKPKKAPAKSKSKSQAAPKKTAKTTRVTRKSTRNA